MYLLLGWSGDFHLRSVRRSKQDGDMVRESKMGEALYNPLLFVYAKSNILLPLVGKSMC